VADGVLLVVDTRTITADDLVATRDQLVRAGANLVGAVVNRAEAPRAKRHGYGYANQYRYGTAVRRGTPEVAAKRERKVTPLDPRVGGGEPPETQAPVARRSAPER
jgi:Mrp family chromosome partitioning ATPase